jgi:hypothetical protein
MGWIILYITIHPNLDWLILQPAKTFVYYNTPKHGLIEPVKTFVSNDTQNRNYDGRWLAWNRTWNFMSVRYQWFNSTTRVGVTTLCTTSTNEYHNRNIIVYNIQNTNYERVRNRIGWSDSKDDVFCGNWPGDRISKGKSGDGTSGCTRCLCHINFIIIVRIFRHGFVWMHGFLNINGQ